MAKKVLIFAGPEGHFSLAEAAKHALSTEYNVEIILKPELLFAFYKPIYLFFPSVFQVIFALFNQPLLLKLAQLYCHLNYDRIVQQALDTHQPDCCIITYFMYNQSVTKYCQSRQIPFFAVVSDPWTFHSITLAPAATSNLVFDTTAEQKAKQLIPAHYTTTGWLVKPDFEATYDQQAVRKTLQLKPNVFTILIAAGSEGSMMVMKVLPSLVKTTQPVQVIVACGHNQHMFQQLQKLGPQIIPISFTPQLHTYMQAADVVVGKAGPNMIFEAVAAHKPFVAITHISGQEDGNLELIKQYQLGWVEEDATAASALLQDIIAHPDQLQSFQPALQRLATYNQRAKIQLKKLVATAVIKPSVALPATHPTSSPDATTYRHESA